MLQRIDLACKNVVHLAWKKNIVITQYNLNTILKNDALYDFSS